VGWVDVLPPSQEQLKGIIIIIIINKYFFHVKCFTSKMKKIMGSRSPEIFLVCF